MRDTAYKFKQIENQRWGIFLQERLLATVGSFEACESIEQSLNKDLSYTDLVKASINYKKAVNRFLILK